MMRSSHDLDNIAVTFDDLRAVANAGMILPATLSQHLGIEFLADQIVDLGSARGYYRPGRKIMTLVHSIAAGGDCIDDANVLRSGSTASVLGHDVMAPSTLGTFLRSFSFGHVRQLDRLTETVLANAWQSGAGPGEGSMTIDVDSTICEVYGYDKQGAAYGYTKTLGYHPLIATRADTAEVLHSRMRTGSANTARGADRFVRETICRTRRAGATGQLTIRADSGFCSHKVIRACTDHDVKFSITAKQDRGVIEAIAAIEEPSWVSIDYTESGEAQVAETTYWNHRLVVRRTRLTGDQADLFPNWRYHAFVTNDERWTVDADSYHRQHAVVETAIRDLKQGAGLSHIPSGYFGANSAWLAITTLVHNLLRWVTAIGYGQLGMYMAKRTRRELLMLPGRLTRGANKVILHLPKDWPWATGFANALGRLRSVRCTT